MKISKMGSANLPVIADRDGTGKNEKLNNPFSSELLLHADNQSKEKLNALLEQITAQGKKLGQVPTYSELKAYRELVRDFLGEAVSRMYTLQSNQGWDRQGRQKLYSTIKEIDHTMATLTEDVRAGQERQLTIMEKLDAIRGMLVDLYT